MEDIKNTAEEIIDHTGELAETYYRLFLVHAADKGSNMLSASISAAVVYTLLFIALLFAGVGAAWWIGESMHDMKAGFFIIGGVFIVLLGVFAACRKKIISPAIRNTIIRKIYA
jgi:apolipoprotein N-acyltransferase